MKFSIVVPTYNRAELVNECIGHNIENAGVDRKDIELVWVDDCSTDNVRDVMMGFNPDIIILKDKNEGVFKAYNAGYAAATGDWIVKMGSDIKFPKDWLLTIRQYIEKIPQSAGIGILINEFFDRADGGWAKEITTINKMPVRIARNFMGVHAFSRKLFEKVGYLDEDFGWYGPGDWDWSDRAMNTKELLYYIPGIGVHHFGTGKLNLDPGRKSQCTAIGSDKLDFKRKYTPNRIYYNPNMVDKYQKRYLEHQSEKEFPSVGLAREEYPDSEKGVLMKIMTNRRSQRIFSGKKVMPGTMKLLYESVRLAPSSCNRQAIYIRKLNEIKDLLVGGSGWINGASRIFLIFADMTAYKSPNEVDFMPYLDAGVVVENLYLMAEALGVSCCFVNPNIRKENIEEFNRLYNTEHNRFCGAMAFGYNKKSAKAPPKRDILLINRQ